MIASRDRAKKKAVSADNYADKATGKTQACHFPRASANPAFDFPLSPASSASWHTLSQKISSGKYPQFVVAPGGADSTFARF